MYIVGIPIFFKDTHQHWNTEYKAAQTIFGSGPTSLAVRTGIEAAHRLLYARSTSNGFGVVQSADDVLKILHGGTAYQKRGKESLVNRVKPAVYTYIISSEDDSFRFSETGAAFFVDFASKHALHANCFETVRYSGEFHPRPEVVGKTLLTRLKMEISIGNWLLIIIPGRTRLIKLFYPLFRLCSSTTFLDSRFMLWIMGIRN